MLRILLYISGSCCESRENRINDDDEQEERGLIFISSDKINHQVVSSLPMKPKREAQMFINCHSRLYCFQRSSRQSGNSHAKNARRGRRTRLVIQAQLQTTSDWMNHIDNLGVSKSRSTCGYPAGY